MHRDSPVQSVFGVWGSHLQPGRRSSYSRLAKIRGLCMAAEWREVREAFLLSWKKTLPSPSYSIKLAHWGGYYFRKVSGTLADPLFPKCFPQQMEPRVDLDLEENSCLALLLYLSWFSFVCEVNALTITPWFTYKWKNLRCFCAQWTFLPSKKSVALS